MAPATEIVCTKTPTLKSQYTENYHLNFGFYQRTIWDRNVTDFNRFIPYSTHFEAVMNLSNMKSNF